MPNRKADLAELGLSHRYEFARSLCDGQSVIDHTPAPKKARGSRQMHSAAHPDGRVDRVLNLAPLPIDELEMRLPTFLSQLHADGILLLTVADDLKAARALIGRKLRWVQYFIQRPVTGTVIAEERFANAKMLMLADAASHQPAMAYLLVASESDMPPIRSHTLYTSDLDIGYASVEIGRLQEARQALPAQERRGTSPVLSFIEDALPGMDERRRIVGFVDRLVELDEKKFDLEVEISALKDQLARQSLAGAAGAFDVSKAEHPWPKADSPATANNFTPHERRPDDDLIDAARSGADFLARFDLFARKPKLAAAADYLNTIPCSLRLVNHTEEPDISIIICVHGQIAYTLNCLESLLTHSSRYSAEIIVVDDCSPDSSREILARVMRLTLVLNAHNLGFLRSCNSAAATARGRIIVLLNNDTRVLPRWLDATVSSFDTFPLAGAVGSKLLYPNGRLQEAGGIVWRDGSAWNYGRGDDPNRPIYTHAREVDYVSGAALAVDAALWRALTGFDEKFAPAYCEDSDLCLRIARAGRKVIYQSEARVLHYEGRTSGTDTSSGVKAYQDINTRKLLLRWHDTLASRRRNGDAPYFERERGVRQRVLVVDATTPTPDQDAGSVTSINTMKDFIALGYKVYFVPEDNFLYDPVYSPQLQRLGIEVAYAPYDHDFKRYIAHYGSLFDAVLVFRFSVLEKTLEVLRTHVPKVPILLSVMDLHYLRLEREAAVLGNAELAAEAAGVKSRELALIEQVNCTLTNSSFEADLLCREVPTAPVYMSPFVYNIEGTAVGFAPRRDCVFVGSYRHPPNVDAAFFFVTSILPMLREHDPGLRIVLVGADPENKLTALRAPGVVLAGHVENLREVMDSARILVCPLRFGAGVKGKIFTALSYGLPVVSTSCGIEGIALSPDRHVLVADLPADFAASCLRLYHDESLWQALSSAGQEFMQEHHSAHRAQRVLADALDAAWHHKLGAASQVSIQRPADAKV